MAVLAADIGGTKIAVGIVDRDGTVRCRREIASRATQGAQHVVGALLALLRETHSAYGRPVDSIGIATGGDVDTDAGRIHYATQMIPGYTGLDLRSIVQREFGGALPVKVENDGNCAALAEAMLGSGRRYRYPLTVIVGTGIGAGFVIDGAIFHGAQGRALNPGQIRLDDQRTWEDIASCGALTRHYGMPIQQIAAAMKNDSSLAEPVLEAGRRVGELLALCAAVLGPDVIVVAGSVLLFGPRIMDCIGAAYQTYVRPPAHHTPVVPASLGPDSALIGAGLL